MSNTTSSRGRAALKHDEGEVLKAYVCPAGRWTIGVGLTKASGVVEPKAGMVITSDESDRLLTLALQRNYEPAVNAEMPEARQHEFDGAVSFHFNTGAIARASWVRKWRAKQWSAMRSALAAWNKGGGKVLPGLVARREREYQLIRNGIYPVPPVATAAGLARIVLNIDADTLSEIRKGFSDLGYAVGEDVRGVLKSSVEAFQRDHDLTVDGIIGRATLSTLQRRLDAKAKAAMPAAAAVTSGGIVAAPMPDGALEVLTGVPGADWVAPAWLALSLAGLTWRGWQYRDVVAALINPRFPNLSAKLRSF